MADYSEFPFDMYSIEEITQMFMDSVRVDDREFVAACQEQINQRGAEQFTESVDVIGEMDKFEGFQKRMPAYTSSPEWTAILNRLRKSPSMLSPLVPECGDCKGIKGGL